MSSLPVNSKETNRNIRNLEKCICWNICHMTKASRINIRTMQDLSRRKCRNEGNHYRNIERSFRRVNQEKEEIEIVTIQYVKKIS